MGLAWFLLVMAAADSAMSSQTPASPLQPNALNPASVDAAGTHADAAVAAVAAADPTLVAALATASRRFDATGSDPERNCWMAVHEHIHGQPPSEYDIREVPEDLYLAVLQHRRRDDQLQH